MCCICVCVHVVLGIEPRAFVLIHNPSPFFLLRKAAPQVSQARPDSDVLTLPPKVLGL